MHLTQFADYALRALLFMGTFPDRLVTVPEIARSYGISQNHLVKAVSKLASLGLVETVRGRTGGLRLALSPSEINVGQLVKQLEPSLALVECFDAETNTCELSPVCSLKFALYEAQKQFFAVLERYTLDQLLANADKFAAIWAVRRSQRFPA
jgi:Rrf2 family nitric oxide-sensitive transcriptional repressor